MDGTSLCDRTVRNTKLSASHFKAPLKQHDHMQIGPLRYKDVTVWKNILWNQSTLACCPNYKIIGSQTGSGELLRALLLLILETVIYKTSDVMCQMYNGKVLHHTGGYEK